jgi:hypothetical protein
MPTKCGYRSNATLPIYQRTRSVQTYTIEDLNPDAFKRPIYLFNGNVTDK